MYLTTEEIKTHLYTEQVNAIGGDDMLKSAILTAIDETRGYLQKYDFEKELKKQGIGRNQSILMFIKDIVIWHYVNICNANTDLDLRLKRYELAIEHFKEIQRGNIVPNLPLKTDEKGNEQNTAPFKFGSNPKRTNHI